jgi:hypothetical protein
MESSTAAIIPGRRLGLKPTDKKHAVVRIGWKNGKPPHAPPAADHLKGWGFELGANDHFGTCGPTSVSNHRDMTTYTLAGKETNAPLSCVFDLYKRSGSPNFDPQTGRGDDGVSMDTLCEAIQQGGFCGVKAIGYGALSDLSDESLYAAINVFGGVLFAVDLQSAQQSQTDQGLWDYRRTPPWGGHAILAAAFDQTIARIDVVSWQSRIGTTASFRAHQLTEVWVPLWPEILTAQTLFDSGVDVAALAADFQALTGKPFPVVIPPTPTPSPSPPSPPTPSSSGKIIVDLDAKTVCLPAGFTVCP